MARSDEPEEHFILPPPIESSVRRARRAPITSLRAMTAKVLADELRTAFAQRDPIRFESAVDAVMGLVCASSTTA
jgi:hypothetical protein